MSKRASLLIALAACGGGSHGDPDAAAPDAAPDAPPAIACNDQDPSISLAQIPGVTAVSPQSCGQGVGVTAKCYAIDFDQVVDHASPATSAHFTQHLLLAHRGCDAPNLVADWGYASFGFFDDELTSLYETNSLWIEHRFQGDSVPDNADWDWTALTIENGADDMHAIVSAFRQHYGGRWVSTGASKGGITATYYKYFFPDDLDGSVPYVAPASRSRIDPAYQDRLDTALPQPCSQQLRDAQVAALTTRRDMLLARLTPVVGAGFESMYLEVLDESLDWGFWQLYGVTYCNTVPTDASTDDEFWNFFQAFTFGGPHPATAIAPADQQMSDGALYYEWLTEQGFALQVNSSVRPQLTEPLALQTMEDNFVQQFPSVTLPPYDGTVTHATRDWVRDTAEDVVLIYGQYDPWSGGAMDQPTHATSGRWFVPNATHGAQILRLDPADQDAALALITPMFGREPNLANKPAAARAGALRDRLVLEHERDAMAAMLRRRLGL